jgi:hypothetical protein
MPSLKGKKTHPVRGLLRGGMQCSTIPEVPLRLVGHDDEWRRGVTLKHDVGSLSKMSIDQKKYQEKKNKRENEPAFSMPPNDSLVRIAYI